MKSLPWRTITGATLIAAILAAVGGPAAVASYRHAWTVADRYGTDPTMNPWLPLTTDGMIVAALTVLVVRRWRRVHVGAWPVIWALLGFAATLAANLAAVSTGRWIATIAVPVVAVWPPIAFAVTLELVVTLLRPGAPAPGSLRRWWTRISDPAMAVRSDRRNARLTRPVVHSPHPDTPTLVRHADQERRHAPSPTLADNAGPDPVDTHADDLDDAAAVSAIAPRAPLVKLTDDDRRIFDEISQRLIDDPHSDVPSSREIRSHYNLGKPRADRIHRYLTGTLESVR